jgi:hypothetical protein
VAAAAGLLALGAFLLLAGGGARALAKGKGEDHLRWQKTWAEAVREARARNALLFATFHKDN